MTPDQLVAELDGACARCGRVMRWCECGAIGRAWYVTETDIFEYVDEWLSRVGDSDAHHQTAARLYASWLRAQAVRR
jgi:hypothetical protein